MRREEETPKTSGPAWTPVIESRQAGSAADPPRQGGRSTSQRSNSPTQKKKGKHAKRRKQFFHTDQRWPPVSGQDRKVRMGGLVQHIGLLDKVGAS